MLFLMHAQLRIPLPSWSKETLLNSEASPSNLLTQSKRTLWRGTGSICSCPKDYIDHPCSHCLVAHHHAMLLVSPFYPSCSIFLPLKGRLFNLNSADDMHCSSTCLPLSSIQSIRSLLTDCDLPLFPLPLTTSYNLHTCCNALHCCWIFYSMSNYHCCPDVGNVHIKTNSSILSILSALSTSATSTLFLNIACTN